MANEKALDALLNDIRSCRICVETPIGDALPHEPRPVFQISRKARLAIFGQAPGKRVHESGRPFTDPSGDRLRAWLGVDEAIFYDADKIIIVPMGFCFPGYNEKGADLPPRKECAAHWRSRVMAELPNVELALLIGGYAQKWHLGKRAKPTITETVAAWREFAPEYLPTPHPSWRNNAWLKKNPWFETALLPALQARVAALVA